MTTDGQYLYLYISQSSHNKMFKIGSGERGTVAGKVYMDAYDEKDGDFSWVYCQGKLYARRTSSEFGNMTLYDPKNFKKLGEARLICEDVFRGNKALKTANTYYPLLTDGESIFTLLLTVEKRERAVLVENEEKLSALRVAKKSANCE